MDALLNEIVKVPLIINCSNVSFISTMTQKIIGNSRKNKKYRVDEYIKSFEKRTKKTQNRILLIKKTNIQTQQYHSQYIDISHINIVMIIFNELVSH